jgi:hypothetical protein
MTWKGREKCKSWGKEAVKGEKYYWHFESAMNKKTRKTKLSWSCVYEILTQEIG